MNIVYEIDGVTLSDGWKVANLKKRSENKTRMTWGKGTSTTPFNSFWFVASYKMQKRKLKELPSVTGS